MNSKHPQQKFNIIGGGIIGAMQAYYAYLEAKKNGEQVRITIHEKNTSITDTTTTHLVPSLTPDEILSVVPRGQELVNKLKLLFNQPGGIRVDDVNNVNDSLAAEIFKHHVQQYSKDESGHAARTRALLNLGKMSMNLWQEFYDNADAELKQILEESNFNPCREPTDANNKKLHDGYRIDLIYGVDNAAKKAEAMRADYIDLQYQHCKLLSPDEVMTIDPYLHDFVMKNTEADSSGKLQWKNDAAALWRPGGCIDTKVFLPKFYTYLQKNMGQYVNEDGKSKNCFQLRLGNDLKEIYYDDELKRNNINGLRFFGNFNIKYDKHQYKRSDYIICPGEAVGTLHKLGLNEPAYAGFAGASLMLNIAIPADQLESYKNFNHCMEVHSEGVVLAWQARITSDNKVFIGVAGTKAFYGDVKPDKNQAFACDRNLLQLNMINDVLPELISFALGRNTKGQKLTTEDMKYLEQKHIAERWVGTRAVTYDGFPTIDNAFINNRIVDNGYVATHLGSGGVSFSHAAVVTSRSLMEVIPSNNKVICKTLQFSGARRKP